jgi:3',5'-cyclic AMP phosphodiesterase CpdA
MRNTRSLIFLTFILCVPLLAWAQHFAIVSDSHVGARDSVYSDTIKRIETEKIQTIFHAGDAINAAGNVRLWKKFLELTGSDKTLHLAPGNHDIDSAKSLHVYSRFFLEPYYSFSQKDTLFVILNTELPGEERRVAGTQLTWLIKELDKPYRYKFVFLHESLYPIVRLHGLDIDQEARDALHRLFVRKGVCLVVAGHDHSYHKSVRDGVVYVIAPRSRLVSGLFINDGEPGYMVANGNGKGYSFTVKDNQGGVLDTFSVKR